MRNGIALLLLLASCGGTSSRNPDAEPSGGESLGLIPATADELRGIPLASTPYSGTELPRTVDLSADMPPPGHQGKQSSCAGWTVTDRTLKPAFRIAKIEPYAKYPDRPEYYLLFNGTVDIPAGLGRSWQMVVHFYWNDGRNGAGEHVKSLQVEFSSVYGQAACGTALAEVGLGVRTEWQAWIPYDAMHLWMGKWVDDQNYQYADNYLVGQVTLFIDNFGVLKSELMPFHIKR